MEPAEKNRVRKGRWRKWIVRWVVAFAIFGVLGGILWYLDSLTGHSRSFAAAVVWGTRYEAWKVSEPARNWNGPTNDVRSALSAGELYQTTNVWRADLSFTGEQWKALEPRRIEPLRNFRTTNGLFELRNPAAPRSGFAGSMGYAYDWTHADFGFGGAAFSNIAVRIKGNVATFAGDKRPFKVDLNQFVKGQKIAGLDELTFNSLTWDQSFMEETLAYEFFRDTGVPTPRTAYAWVRASVAGKWDQKPLGLYAMIETVDQAFVGERFGSRETALFKPVTYRLFEYLGENWADYAAIYDLKTKATPQQQRRIIEFARLVTSGTDAQFREQAAEYLDFDEFARFLAGEVLLSNYDSILALGQNFYLYLDPRSNKLGFIPWDLGTAWGDFWIGSREELQNASIWRPWVGEVRLLERLMNVGEFRRLYRGHLEDFSNRLLVPARLQKRIDEIAAGIREPITAESSFRLAKFDQVVGAKPVERMPGETRHGIRARAYPLVNFIQARQKSVREQLDGKSSGIIVKTPAEK